jgi:hypothetical protein
VDLSGRVRGVRCSDKQRHKLGELHKRCHRCRPTAFLAKLTRSGANGRPRDYWHRAEQPSSNTPATTLSTLHAGTARTNSQSSHASQARRAAHSDSTMHYLLCWNTCRGACHTLCYA